jgi:transcriptional regulator with XRE-family HTH domain
VAPYFKCSTWDHGFGMPRARQLLTTFCFTPRASASLPTPSSARIAVSSMSMATLYHFSVVMQTTKVLHGCDVLTSMQETQGQRLKRLRKAKGLTQRELGKFGGLGQTAIANIEADVRGYGSGIVGIAKALDTTPEYLQLEDQRDITTGVLVAQEPRAAYGFHGQAPQATSAWPFYSVTPSQYSLLDEADRLAIEQHIHLFVKARGDPEKRSTPAKYITSA